ncbi:TlpA family protein disulfide reductase [Flavobacterium branchiophilum]|uniref:Thioredoxin domain-containing protein n=1 Tax=Flavobacterium branchiophilum TaxID=55197 RepID=A0A2H3KX74_9FLAO|nr:TlpA disulfide reductase family protein [Flavobacterium branchiophilum]PDS25505.1 hypothetical protein B0A77_04935 [Flavobacterium branchiophilum]
MKKIAIALLSCLNVAAFAQQKLHFKATITNKNHDYIVILEDDKTIQKINLNKNGVFDATFDVKEGFYNLYDGVEYTQLFLKNNYDLHLKMDAKQFDESIHYEGIGANENNFLAQSALNDEKFDLKSLLSLNENQFQEAINNKIKSDIELLKQAQLDPTFTNIKQKSLEESKAYFTDFYKQVIAKKALNNSPAPSFDYRNINGKKTKLEDLKGQYVYIDVWATWCGPCRAEIPFLSKVEKEFHQKNIAFVSISIDEEKDFEKWKKFVTSKNLGGIQLFADKNWNSDFITSLQINSIPRFILIDPSGKIIDADAPRPSDNNLIQKLNLLLQ